MFFSGLFGRFKGAIAAGLGIAAYTLLVGAEPAVVRAASARRASTAWPFVAYTIRAVELFGRLQGGVLALGAVGVLGVAGYYAVLFAWMFAGDRTRQAAAAVGPGLSLAVASLLTVIV